MPFSDAMLRQVEPEQALRWALSGGEDYELCFTVPNSTAGRWTWPLPSWARFTCIGQILPESEGLQFTAKVSRSR
jgi:thiamine-monophosphate kinase